MGKAEKKPTTSKRATEPVSESEEIIPVVALKTFTQNKQGQLVWKTSYIRQSAEQPKKARQPSKQRKHQRVAEDEKLPRGRSRIYARDPIDPVARKVARKIGPSDKLDWYAAQIGEECKAQNIEYPKPSQLKNIYRKTFMAARKRARKKMPRSKERKNNY